MRAFAFALIIIGIFLMMHAYYEQRVKEAAESNVRVEYRFIPRSYYDEQLGKPDVADKFKSMFKEESITPGM